MKKTTIALFLLVSGNFLFAQDRHHRSPEPVQQSFHKDYPNANNEKWSQRNGQWHAEFNDRSEHGRGEMFAHYDRDGRRIDSHIPYNRHDVPAPVMDRVKKRYHGASNYRFEKIEHPSEGAFFQVRLNLRGSDRTIYLDEQGNERKYNDRH